MCIIGCTPTDGQYQARYIHIPLGSSAGFCDLLADFLRCPPSGASAWIGAIEIAEMPPWIRRTPFRRSGGRGRVQKSGMAVWRDRSLPGAVARNMRVAAEHGRESCRG